MKKLLTILALFIFALSPLVVLRAASLVATSNGPELGVGAQVAYDPEANVNITRVSTGPELASIGAAVEAKPALAIIGEWFTAKLSPLTSAMSGLSLQFRSLVASSLMR